MIGFFFCQTPVFCNLHHAEQMCQKQMPDVRRRAREMNELRSAYPEGWDVVHTSVAF